MKNLHKFILSCFVIFFGFIFLTYSSHAASPDGNWVHVGNMNSTRVNHSATLLNDGRVLVAGGNTSNADNTLISFGDIYNPVTKTWSETGNLNMPRMTANNNTLVTLQTGKALIAGGEAQNNTPFNTSELYDPTSGTWSYTGNLNTPRRSPNLEVLNDGRALIVGGTANQSGGALNTSELYDPTSGTWSYTANSLSTSRIYGRTIKMLSGKVLIVGGFTPDNCTNTAELFDPSTNTWSNAGTLSWASANPQLTNLPDGRVFATGGYCNGVVFSFSAIYDPNSNSWTPAASMAHARAGAVMFTLSNGEPIISGGVIETGNETTLSEIYNPISNTWSAGPSLNDPRGDPKQVTLQNGDVLTMGGFDCDPGNPACVFNTAEIFIAPNQSPVINALSDITLNEGSTYSTTSSFIDPDSSSWTATVNYGDSSGVQNLPLNPDKTFNLSHVYQDEGTYMVTVKVIDNQGATGTGTATVTVNNATFTVNNITTPTNPTQLGTPITASASYFDPGTLDTHTASWNWGDGNTTTGTVTEANGSGTISDTHTYTTDGVYTVTLTVTDDDGVSQTSTFQYVVIFDPSAGFVTGGGTITSPTGAYTQNPSLTSKANFGFISKYQKGATIPSGNTEFQFKLANFNFHSTSYDWLVVGGAKAQYKGSGTINGTGDYQFILAAIDGEINGGGGVDKFRIKITDKTTGDTIYDNQSGAPDTSDPTTVIDSGDIVIHK